MRKGVKTWYNHDILFKNKEEKTPSNNPPSDPYVSVSPCCGVNSVIGLMHRRDIGYNQP